MTEVNQNTRAELSRTEVCTPTQNPTGRRSVCRPPVHMDPAIVRLEEPKRESVIEERQIVIHSATSRSEPRPHPVRIVIIHATIGVWPG